METTEGADARGLVDIALVQAAADAGLRRSELAALTWGDIKAWNDGSGRLSVRRSKTDQEGQGAIVYLSPQALADLDAIKPAGAAASDPVFGLGPAQLSRRIAAAARHAGLEGTFSGKAAGAAPR